ncbi:Lon protease (S16) C-terminal proteolytic domain [seawater metagenome]|uniref:Lon protease (S16) C-terminal proteolytic domain n=1 Tax=seawater metagenome TaxID=1561972 RepID=A0A5E8CIS2_9ZZZZ
MTVEISLKKFKIYSLQKEYNEISSFVIEGQNHVLLLYNSLIIDTSQKNNYLGKFFELAKELNSAYNNYIIQECNSEEEDSDKFEKIELDTVSNVDINDENLDINENDELNKNKEEYTLLSCIINNNIEDEEKLYEKLHKFILKSKMIEIIPKNFKNPTEEMMFSDNFCFPLLNIKKKVLELNKNIGFKSLNQGLAKIIGNDYQELFDKENIKEIEFYDDIFIQTSYKISTSASKNSSIISLVKKDNKNSDSLEYLVNIEIKIPNNNNLIIFTGYFQNDNIGVHLKTSQISNKYLYLLKKKKQDKLNENNSINKRFKKNFMKHISLTELLVFTEDEFCEIVEDYYNKYTDLSNKSFMNIMKEFIGKNNTIKNMFEIIRLLLLGTEENENVAGLLYGLTKEKKLGSFLISDLIYNNLNYACQLKIKRANINLKEEFEKIKSLSIEDVDLKKQVLALRKMPDVIKSLALEKVEEMKSSNNEYYKQMTFVKCLIKYPWACPEDDLYYKDLKEDLNRASKYILDVETKLNALSYGHKEAKKSLLQLIGKWISNPTSSGSSIALVGPPGVGKTLLAKSVSSALGVPFAQITLGGQNDGELLHGHGYTYSGSQPGMIIRKMIETGQSRCIIYFDELDKACSKHGVTNEITSILIHLTDPNMNKSFQDRFFQGIDFPLDKVIMIFSYNDSSLIDPILIDRFKEIEVKPYNVTDKLEIVRNYIIPELMNNIGFNKDSISLSNNVIENLIEKYTNEAGVRGIKRMIESILLKLNLDKICSRGVFKNSKKTIDINNKIIQEILSKPNSDNTMIHSNPEIGIVNGLYATSIGTGGIVPIQIFRNYSVSGAKFNFKLTGKLGKVMKESIHCSYTAAVDYIKQNFEELKKKVNISCSLDDHISNNFQFGFHVHAPSTSTPKDGPSAGGAFSVAFISRILNVPLRNDVALTGEIDLLGKITKIGGLNYKLIGAKKAGVIKALVPLENKEDVDDIKKNNPNLINKDFEVVIVDTIDDIVKHLLMV